MRTVDLRGRVLKKSEYAREIPRADLNVDEAIIRIKPILDRVSNGTEDDLKALSEEFDGVRPTSIRVPQSALDSALAELDPKVRTALEEAIRRTRKVHQAQQRAEILTEVVDGGRVDQRWIPVDRVGLYVPGGRAVYPSSVMMNVVPAQIAGVGSIAVA